jgi:hypothetical protein
MLSLIQEMAMTDQMMEIWKRLPMFQLMAIRAKPLVRQKPTMARLWGMISHLRIRISKPGKLL